MKAIIINGEFKYQNYFISKNQFNDVINVKDASAQQWYDWGFREYVIPTYTNLQKLGEMYFDNISDTITHYIIDKTQVEINEDILQAELQARQELDNDIVGSLEDKYEEDGKLLYRRIKHRIRRLLADGTITLVQFNLVRKFLRPAILPLTTGDWDIAKENVDALQVPTNAKLLAILNKVKELINNYITENNIV